jgi:beta-mannan synthase
LFLDHVECLNEVPATYEAYRKQQHRWSCGPMQLWRKATSTVWASNVSLCHKL